MATITTRAAKGSALTHNEVDDNFLNLNASLAVYDGAFQIAAGVMEVNYTFRLEDPTDITKKAEFVMSGITTGTTRQYTMPNASGTLATLANTSQTFLGSTTIAPTTNSGTVTIGATPQTGTLTFGRSTVTQTVDIAVGATTAVSTKTVNIGTTGVSGSTTNINIGSAVAGSLGAIALNSNTTMAAGYTMTLNSGTANGVTYLNASKVLTSGTALTFDGANLGLGVTPSAWGASTKSLSIGASGAAFIEGRTDAFRLNIGLNAYDTGSDTWKYAVGLSASLYKQIDAQHHWYNAPAGTAGAAITFTQAMTLDASGNLLVGTTSSPAAASALGKIVKVGGVNIEGTNQTTVGTTFVDITKTIGTGAFIYVSGYRLPGGSRAVWVLLAQAGTINVISTINADGIPASFQASGDKLQMKVTADSFICVAASLTTNL